MERVSLMGFVYVISLAGCAQPFELEGAAQRGALGEVRGFDGEVQRAVGTHRWDRSTIELVSEGETGWRVMTRLSVWGGLEGLAEADAPSLDLLGCSGPDGVYTFDRYADRVEARIEPTDDPARRRVVYRGEWDEGDRVHEVEGSFLYAVPEGMP